MDKETWTIAASTRARLGNRLGDWRGRVGCRGSTRGVPKGTSVSGRECEHGLDGVRFNGNPERWTIGKRAEFG